MGLSYRPGGASWSYEGFGRLREQIAKFEGIDDLGAWWRDPFRAETVTPLHPWLNGEDVQGFFTSSQCEQMIPRFKAILEFLGDRLSTYDRGSLEALVAGMQHCAEHGCAMSWG